MIAPSAADDVAGASNTGKRLRKLRFLMTDNSLPAPSDVNFTLSGKPEAGSRLVFSHFEKQLSGRIPGLPDFTGVIPGLLPGRAPRNLIDVLG